MSAARPEGRPSGPWEHDEVDLVAEVAEQFMRELRAGEHPSIEEFADRHPAIGASLRRLLPLIAEIEELPAADPSTSRAARGRLSAGDRVGPYEVVRELGVGGMGTVYETRTRDGARVALKLVHAHLLDQEGALDRFLREARIGQQIEHPNVVRTLTSGEFDGQPFVALEFVVGQTLDELRAELGRVPEVLCRHIGLQVARGLEAIHAAGIVHRDIKPTNVLITPDDEIRLVDLGLARALSGADRVTMTGQLVGSPAYCPPEQLEGTADLDARSDLYSLGVTLYELSTGERPFRAETLGALALRVLEGEPTRPGTLCTQLSPFFEEVLLSLLARDPARRIASARELADLLEFGEDSEWWNAQATRIQDRTRRPLRRIRIPREAECVGRDDELRRLRSAYAGAKKGEGSVVLLTGEAGIGKSRLIDELIRLLERDGEDVNVLYGSYPPGGAATATGAFTTAYREHFGREGSARYLPETPLLVPAFDALLRGDVPPPTAQPLNAASLRTTFVRATQALGRERPTIVVIDDLHFAPDEGRALFASLAMAVPGQRILLIGSARPAISRQWTAELDRLEHVARMDVPRLGREHVSRLLTPLLGTTPQADRLAGSVARTADGNPYFLFEIVRSLRESGVVRRSDDGSWATSSQVDRIRLPETVQSVLEERLGRLSDEQREVLECAACWGHEFDGRLIAAALGLRALPTLRALGRLEHEDGLVRAAGGMFVFDHHATQEHLYARLSEAFREELHAALAEALEEGTGAADVDPRSLDGGVCADLCRHFAAGARGESACRYLPAAQAHLARAHRHEEVAALTERLLSVPDLLTGSPRANALLRMTEALYPMGATDRLEAAAKEAEPLAEAAGDPMSQAQAATLLGRMYCNAHRLEEGRAAFGRALEIARRIGDRRGEAAAIGNLGSILKFENRLDEAREHYERSIALSQEIGAWQVEASASGNLGNVYQIQGGQERALALQERQIELSRNGGDLFGEATATGNLGLVLQSMGRLREAREHHERHLQLARRIGDRLGESRAIGNLGNALFAEGRISEARALYEQNLQMAEQLDHLEGRAYALLNLAGAHREVGDYEAEARCAEAARDVAIEIGSEFIALLASSSLASARLLMARGTSTRPEGVREALEATLEGARRIGLADVEATALCDIALLDEADAAECIARAAELVDDLDARNQRLVRHQLYNLTGDREQLRRAKQLLDELVASTDPDLHEAILTNIRENRELMESWTQEFGSASAPTSGTGDADGGAACG